MIGLVGIFSDKVIDLRTTRTYLSGFLADTISPHGLDATGYIDWVSGTARGIKVLDRNGEPVPNVPQVQVVGYVQAGEPIHYFSLQGAGSSEESDSSF